MQIDTNAVLNFWFDGASTPTEDKMQLKEKWFVASPEFDEEIKRNFESYIELASAETIDNLQDYPNRVLSRILILDQFPRNIYRGTPKAFAYDKKALSLTLACIETGIHDSFTYLERLFVYMPLQHAEDMKIQDLSVKMFQYYVDNSETDAEKDQAKQSLSYAQLHREIIEKFSRFPHRNEILGRKSTPEEIEYLSSGAETFGQTKKED